MPRRIDVPKLKNSYLDDLNECIGEFEKVQTEQEDYEFVRSVARMAAIEIHRLWERYVEDRLVAALNHDPKHFLKANDIKGVKNVSSGLAIYVVRGGGGYFDFRSMSDLLDKGKRWLGSRIHSDLSPTMIEAIWTYFLLFAIP
jgi:hypothetical protein